LIFINKAQKSIAIYVKINMFSHKSKPQYFFASPVFQPWKKHLILSYYKTFGSGSISSSAFTLYFKNRELWSCLSAELSS